MDAAPSVEFYLDSELVRIVKQPPYTATINLTGAAIGNHSLEVRATSSHGLVSRSAERYIEVLGLPPPNDNFATRAVLSGFLATVPVDSRYATREAGEPDTSPWPGLGTLWWTWTAPVDGTLALGMTDGGSSSLSLWTGATLSTLQFEAAGSAYNPALAVHVSRGSIHQIVCSGYKSALHLFLQPDGYPAFSRVAPTENGLFGLTFETLVPQAWVIEASSDLYQWQPVSTNSSLQNVLEFVDPESQKYPQRFYRFTALSE